MHTNNSTSPNLNNLKVIVISVYWGKMNEQIALILCLLIYCMKYKLNALYSKQDKSF